MKVDSFDNTLVCEKSDLQEALSYFKDSRKIPEYIEISILKCVLKRLGIETNRLMSIDDLLSLLPSSFIKKCIQDINTMFTTKVDYENSYLSYLIYYLPANLFKIWKPLLDLHLKSTLKHDLVVLDVGTGPGSIPTGIIEFYKSLAISYPDIQFSLTFDLVDSQQEFLAIAVELIESVTKHIPNNLSVKLGKVICKLVSNQDLCFNNRVKYDLITMSNFLTVNEKSNQQNASAIVGSFEDKLRFDGAIVIIEPGDKQSCVSLKSIRNELVNNKTFSLYAPCAGIWENKDIFDCYCFSTSRAYWDTPRIYEYLNRKGLGKGKKPNVPFTYVILRKDGLRKHDLNMIGKHYTPLKDLAVKHNQSVNICGIIRTVIERTNGEVLLALCDGSCTYGTDISDSILLKLTKQQREQNHIDIPLIAGEKLTLKKVIPIQQAKQTYIQLAKNSEIKVDY
jgi:hypothetical protein